MTPRALNHADLRPAGDRELDLLIACARPSVEPAEAERICAIVEGGLNWDRVWTLAQRHGLSPLLYWHLSRLCAASVPAARLAFLRDYFQKNSAFNLLFTGELTRLLSRLDAQGIEAVPFKGPAIAAKLYGQVTLRQFCDLDIMVRERDVWSASRLLEAEGFRPQFHIPEERRAAFVHQDYVLSLSRDDGRTVIELHWRVAPRSFGVRFRADDIWPRLEPMALQGATVRMPCLEDLLLMLCVHGGRHIWDKLEGVAAVAEIMRRRPALDWADVWERSRRMHCRRMLEVVMRLAHGLFDVPLPAEVEGLKPSPPMAALLDTIVRECQVEDDTPRKLSRQLSLDLQLKDTPLDQLRECVGVVMTPTPDDWAAVRLHQSLSFAYPLLRAIRVARRFGSTV